MNPFFFHVVVFPFFSYGVLYILSQYSKSTDFLFTNRTKLLVSIISILILSDKMCAIVLLESAKCSLAGPTMDNT